MSAFIKVLVAVAAVSTASSTVAFASYTPNGDCTVYSHCR